MSNHQRGIVRGGLCAVVIASLAGVATVQATGPDVIVGDLPSVTSPVGPANNQSGESVYAYAVGTTSCNVGDTPLNWWANWNEHPVIGQNIYRLDMSNSRFMQVGQIWLKHGFTALQGTVCGSCSATAGTTLGVGCSDPYSAGLNAGQSGLGPKSEVTPSTGEYPYPWVNNGTGSGAIFKRLQVRATDLAAANSQWFCSGQYICHDDVMAGNGNNNESYRRMTLSGQTFTTVDTTQRGIPAIFAWRAHGLGANTIDNNVNIATVDIPNDARQLRLVGGSGGAGAGTASGAWMPGRVFVGCKVVQTAANQWRYEYAIENLNSDRGIQAVQIPLVAGATVFQAGFRDVDYHSGEPYALTDWTPGNSGGVFSWSTQTFAQNTNANALRWGTLYNYWIETNAAPTTGSVTMQLFKPVPAGAPGGTPTAVSATITVPGNVSGGTTPPTNDACASALTITNGTYFFDTTFATSSGPDACTAAGSAAINNDVWYRYTSPNCDTPVTISTCGSTFDTKVAVYNNACPTVAGSEVACNDDSTTCGSGSLQSNIVFNATANTTYLIRVGGFGTAVGTGSLAVSGVCAPPPAPAPARQRPLRQRLLDRRQRGSVRQHRHHRHPVRRDVLRCGPRDLRRRGHLARRVVQVPPAHQRHGHPHDLRVRRLLRHGPVRLLRHLRRHDPALVQRRHLWPALADHLRRRRRDHLLHPRRGLQRRDRRLHLGRHRWRRRCPARQRRLQ